MEFSRDTRRRGLERAAGSLVDLVVVGGGITGAGVAREAALRGLSVVLLEKADFASGTSSRSSKLIHGGIRYLEQGDIGLVREAARERAVLRNIAPHLAVPTPMMIPAGSKAGRVKLAAGLWSFARLASGRGDEQHRQLGAKATYDLEPLLKPGLVAGSVVMSEYATDDARLTLETVRSAAAAGAIAANYAEVSSIVTDPEGLKVGALDVATGESFVVRCRCLVNAAGPWFDRVRALHAGSEDDRVQLTRGIHVVVPHNRLPVRSIIILKAADGRSTFVVPSGRYSYIGTTDTVYEGEPEEPGASVEDVAYLLASVAHSFEDAPEAADIIGTWSGVRPLLKQDGRAPSEISRRDEIVVGPGPVVSVAGGKLTTFRRMAERVVRQVVDILRVETAEVDSSTIALVGGSLERQRAARAEAPKLDDPGLSARLWGKYGTAAASLVASISSRPEAAEPVGGLAELTRVEVEYAVQHEMALCVDDLVRRRCRVAHFDTARATAAAAEVSRLLGALLGWDDGHWKAAAERLRADLEPGLDTVRAA